MAALWVHDLLHPGAAAHPTTPLAHPLELFTRQACHGGLWRCPYLPRSALPFAAALGWVRQRLRINRARVSGAALKLEASLIGGDGKRRSANIIRFLEKSVTLAQSRKRSKAGTINRLFVQVKRKGGRKPLSDKTFIGNKGRTVFKRDGKDRLPISPVQVIDVAQMFNTRRINRVVVDKLQAKFPEIFEREAAFFLARFNAGVR
jgi:hypothetical protein